MLPEFGSFLHCTNGFGVVSQLSVDGPQVTPGFERGRKNLHDMFEAVESKAGPVANPTQGVM